MDDPQTAFGWRYPAAFKSRLHQARLRVRAAISDEALIEAAR